jgi:hypothetical protein
LNRMQTGQPSVERFWMEIDDARWNTIPGTLFNGEVCVALLVLVTAVSPLAKGTWLLRPRNVGTWLAMAVMASPPVCIGR